MSFFEAGMLVCFGAAWPFAVYRSFKARTCKGKSPVFLVTVLTGYLLGITHKLLFSRDVVLALYIINAVMVSFDLLLYLRNRRLDRAREQKQSAD